MLNGIDPRQDPLKTIAPAFAVADIAIANLEIPLTDVRTPTRLKSAADLKARRQFVLRADPRHLTHLRSAGFDLLALGNNHTMDFGPAGMRQTRALLRRAGIGAAGAGENQTEAEAPAVFALDRGPRVALVSYLAFVTDRAMAVCGPAGPQRPGIATLNLGGQLNTPARERLRAIVARARTQADIVVVALHWGIERESRPREWQVRLGRAFASAGADVVLGAHPHVLQGVEVVNGTPILYSTGNLISARPGRTAVYTLRFRGRHYLGMDIRPVDLRGGRAAWVPARAEATRRAEIAALDRLLPAPPLARPAPPSVSADRTPGPANRPRPD